VALFITVLVILVCIMFAWRLMCKGMVQCMEKKPEWCKTLCCKEKRDDQPSTSPAGDPKKTDDPSGENDPWYRKWVGLVRQFLHCDRPTNVEAGDDGSDASDGVDLRGISPSLGIWATPQSNSGDEQSGGNGPSRRHDVSDGAQSSLLLDKQELHDRRRHNVTETGRNSSTAAHVNPPSSYKREPVYSIPMTPPKPSDDVIFTSAPEPPPAMATRSHDV
jgi:hypothetical protein